jgi:hypothetical protein
MCYELLDEADQAKYELMPFAYRERGVGFHD